MANCGDLQVRKTPLEGKRTKIIMRIRKAIVLPIATAVVATAASTQTISVGVKGGIPLVEAFSTDNRDPLFAAPVTYSSITRHYTVGPTAEIGLPFFGLAWKQPHFIGESDGTAAEPPLICSNRIPAPCAPAPGISAPS